MDFYHGQYVLGPVVYKYTFLFVLAPGHVGGTNFGIPNNTETFENAFPFKY